MFTTAFRNAIAVIALVGVGCAGSATPAGDDGELLTSADEVGDISAELSSGVPIGSTLRTVTGLNLRTGPSMSSSVRTVIPSGATVVTINSVRPEGGWYNVKYNGLSGYSHGAYLKLVTSGPTTGTQTTSAPNGANRDAAIERAKSGVGFSYFWGHGSWIPYGATSSTKGVCTGSCPNCSHSGRYGADCSGYVAKIWQVPSTNTDLTDDEHPYSTLSFKGASSLWNTVSRGAVVKGDALVHNDNGSGHIFLYESGDGWGSMWAYEARGCSYGIVHNLRTAGSTYKAIARAGY